MGNHLHLFRRGNIFYLRRRLPTISTENGFLQLSLRTADRREAYIIARKLTAESDRMLDAISNNLLSLTDARAWSGHVIAQELARGRVWLPGLGVLAEWDHGMGIVGLRSRHSICGYRMPRPLPGRRCMHRREEAVTLPIF